MQRSITDIELEDVDLLNSATRQATPLLYTYIHPDDVGFT